ncbi:MAG: hypothetical protein ACYDEI_00725 [Erysipelotrichaceae bacterium]
MKILTSLIGLILFGAGIYLTYWVFLDFESYETLMLGLYLGASFILMTLGFYLFLLPLSFKPKNKISYDEKISTDIEPISLSNLEPETISEIDAIEMIREDVVSKDISITQEIKQYSLDTEKVDLIESKQELTEELKFITDEVYEIIEMRVIGIDAWSSQNILKKLDENSILEISQKLKSGINMTQVTYNNKLIGYVSRLDMNKVTDRLSELVSVYPSNIIKEGHKIVHFSINLKFKQKDHKHE